MKKLEKKDRIDARKAKIKASFSKMDKIFDKMDKTFLKSWFFIVIVALLGAGTVLGTVLYINYGIGAYNEIFVVKMLDNGLTKGQWAAVTAFAVGFLIARVLEGPLVGILDLGGSILTGVGIGIPASFLAVDATSELMKNPWFGLTIGLVAGAAIGGLIILIRLFAKTKIQLNLGTSIMMGAGNQTGAFLSPLVIVAAAMVNPIVGIGAAIGGASFVIWGKPTLGGAILGSMIFGIIPAFL